MAACSALSWVLVFASPFVLYVTVKRARVEEAAALILAFALIRALPVVLTTKREHLLAALRVPLVAVLSAMAGLVTNEPRALLVLPSLSQLAFGGLFLASLRGVPLVEHFARMQQKDLRAAQVRYCRTVTLVWGVVLSVSALVGLLLAAKASIEVWTAFTTVGSYALVAGVFSAEYVIRKIRFREYGSMPVDKVLSRFFPPSHEGESSLRATDAALPGIVLRTDAHGVVDAEIAPDCVYFRGHFDSAPILPGVVQLTEIVLPIARGRHPELGPVRELRRVRFRRPIVPNDVVRVTLGPLEISSKAAAPAGASDERTTPSAQLQFDLHVAAHLVASGAVVFELTR